MCGALWLFGSICVARPQLRWLAGVGFYLANPKYIKARLIYKLQQRHDRIELCGISCASLQ